MTMLGSPRYPSQVAREPSFVRITMADETEGTIGQTQYLSDIVELQRTELTRLLRENKRVNERLDQMVNLQEREQVLRQQMQETLDRLTAEKLAISGSITPSADALDERIRHAERRYDALKQTVGLLINLIEDRPRLPG